MSYSGSKLGQRRPSGAAPQSRTEPSGKEVAARAESSVPPPLGKAWRNGHSALAAALNLTADAVYFVSLEDMRICAANVAATARTGYHTGELVGMRLTEVVAVTEGFDPVEEYYDDAELAALAARGIEHTKDGQQVDVEIRWRRVASDGDSLLVAAVREVVVPEMIAPPAIEADPCDPLTGLPSRVRLASRVRALERRLRGIAAPVALLFLDVDRFKEINDTHGHLVGDRVLCEVAQRLLRCVRQDDLVVRYGGDEFVVLLDAVRTRQQVEQMVERIAAEIRAPVALAEGHLIVSASIGLAMAHEAAEIADLLEMADQAMYRVKRASRRVPR
ncbi:MAG TPA: sensor domain-containing diguanylate cyclase [Pirellulales bacterium]|nr:sensor domain-containing diguanylate cyclase [Pirellulales bacterium]